MPYLKPFLGSLDSGMIRNDGIHRLGEFETNAQTYTSSVGMKILSQNRYKQSTSKIANRSLMSEAIIELARTVDGGKEIGYDDRDATLSLNSTSSESRVIKTTSINVYLPLPHFNTKH
ncbi:hypothetical protein EAE99_010606 [Botrytis elliptica]|nr:hypothetical protein EAE99_010606 [Botrytis elliptica]